MTDALKPKAVILDLDALMDMKMDAITTLPDYITPPPGLYVLTVKDASTEKYEVKVDKKETGQKATRIKIVYQIKETVALEAGEDPVPNESLFSESFQGSEDGVQYFKKAAMNILGVTDFDGASIRDVMDGITGTQFRAKLTLRRSSKDGKDYENLQIRAVSQVVSHD